MVLLIPYFIAIIKITKELVKLHKGEIKLESKVNEGTKFIIGIFAISLNDQIAQFNFRARAINEYYRDYIYTDTNTETICKTKRILA